MIEDEDEYEMNEKSFQVFVRIRPLIPKSKIIAMSNPPPKPISVQVDLNKVQIYIL